MKLKGSSQLKIINKYKELKDKGKGNKENNMHEELLVIIILDRHRLLYITN